MIYRFIWVISLMYFGCAQMRPLTGGEKDTIPPNIIQTTPNNLSTNIKGNDFYFVFDEVIDGSKLKEKLIISPFYDGSFDSKIKKNTLLLSFDSSFNKETTYIFSFADGISDITEGNPSIYSKFVFSTGNKIDSFFVSGLVFDPLENEFLEGAVVGLYNEEDSFDLFEKKPTYFSLTDENGFFKIENIKLGKYTIYAFADENKNFKAEYKAEKFGFVGSPIEVSKSLDKFLIPMFNEDLTPISIQRTRKKGSIFDVVYNKRIKSYAVDRLDLTHSLYDNNTVSFFNKNNNLDSALVILSAFDETNKKTIDTFYVHFSNEEQKNIKINKKFIVGSDNVNDTVTYVLETNVPLNDYNYKSNFYIDTVKVPDYYFIDKKTKKNNNTVEGSLFVIIDSVNVFLKNLKEKITNDSLGFESDSLYRVYKRYYSRLNTNKIIYKIKKGELITFTGDTIGEIKKDFNLKEDEYFGGVSGLISDKKNNYPYVVSLVSENLSKILKNETKAPNFKFTKIEPGKYYLKIFKDKNNNRKWDYYSITSKKQSETILYFEELIEVRSNWSIEDIIVDVDLLVDKLFLEDSLFIN